MILSSQQQDALLLTGWLHLQYGHPERASTLLVALLQLHPANQAARRTLLVALLRQGFGEEALGHADLLMAEGGQTARSGSAAAAPASWQAGWMKPVSPTNNISNWKSRMNQRSLELLRRIGERKDIMLAVLLLAIVFMMVLPLPPVALDILIAINMTISVVLLMMAVYINSPLQFSAFPAVLLITTLFRLALSVSTTRMILLQADAGQIVYTFGNFVVGGNLVVGIVIFLIITIVQFLVITKGSERVAEVSARFSLDAMPGKQMSIDGDMRAGVIDVNEARERRSVIEKESQMFGSMDGAMKFVKGDAIAGLIIIFVNILGGVTIGVTQKGLSAADALQLYSILTVGDGMVSQVPALLIAITAGIIVTRVSSEESSDLGSDIGAQVVAQPKAMLIGGLLLVLFGLIPGFPMITFFSLAAVVTAGDTLSACASARRRISRARICPPCWHREPVHLPPAANRRRAANRVASWVKRRSLP